jgi:hypothetical protein
MKNDPPEPIERRGAVFHIQRSGEDFSASWIRPIAIFPCESVRDSPLGDGSGCGLQKRWLGTGRSSLPQERHSRISLLASYGDLLRRVQLSHLGDPMHVETSFARNLGDPHSCPVNAPDRSMKAIAVTMGMHADEESDGCIVVLEPLSSSRRESSGCRRRSGARGDAGLGGVGSRVLPNSSAARSKGRAATGMRLCALFCPCVTTRIQPEKVTPEERASSVLSSEPGAARAGP